MEKSRYSVLDSSGKATIVERKDGRYIDIEEMAQHVPVRGAAPELHQLLFAAVEDADIPDNGEGGIGIRRLLRL